MMQRISDLELELSQIRVRYERLLKKSNRQAQIIGFLDKSRDDIRRRLKDEREGKGGKKD
jgi:hypothetical protein